MVVERFSSGVALHGHSRMWWGYLACGLIVCAIIVGVRMWRSGKPFSFASYLRALLAPHFWRKATCWVDLKVAAVLHIFDLFWGAATGGLVALIAAASAVALGARTDGAPPHFDAFGISAITLLMLLATDFSKYVDHFLRHKVQDLWAFHRVHHSSERLTMISNSRLHPMDRVVQLLCALVIAAPLLGLISFAFGGLDFWVLWGANIGLTLKDVLVANLQHTHVRWSFPRPLCYILVSPSMHQIHHSKLDHHWDKNYGEIFAIWDWLFGTLYLPKPNERIVFGLSAEFGDVRPRPHKTLKAALLEPFTFAARKRALAQKPPIDASIAPRAAAQSQ